MDSGNSGSMQSSSGGDEEYDSRAESISAFLNNPPPPPPPPTTTHVGPFTTSATISNHPNPHPSLPQQHQHTIMFDPLSNYLDPTQRSPSLPNPNSLLNLDMMWSKASRSEPNHADLGGLIPCSSSTQNQAFLSSQLAGQTRGVAAFPTTHHSLPLPPESASRGLLSVSNANDQTHNNNNSVVRNPKKRSRASRRAPTTVLTTDTTNFRAMVQEFTGIPAPPFTSSPFPRTRLDLFGSAATSTIRSHLDPSPPPYLLRPFAQKIQPPHLFPSSTSSIPSSFPHSSSLVDTLASNNSTNSSNNSTSINYQLSSSSGDHLGLLKQQPLNVNMHNNPILSLQSILQAPQKYHSLGNSSLLASSKTQPSLEIPPSTVDSHIKMGVLEELGLSHAHVNTNVSGLHQNMVSSSSDGALSRVNNNNNIMRNPSADWAQRTGTITNNHGDHGGVLRSLSGTGNGNNYSNIIPERVSNGKLNYSAPSSDFHGEKGPECAVAARSEGMVESWINCSSD